MTLRWHVLMYILIVGVKEYIDWKGESDRWLLGLGKGGYHKKNQGLAHQPPSLLKWFPTIMEVPLSHWIKTNT